MPSKKKPLKPLPKRIYAPERDKHVFFVPMLFLAFTVWVIYRAIFRNEFPVWFDETIGKALFFGLPVWFYIIITNARAIPETFSLAKLKPGLMLGVAVGGVYGFAAAIASLLAKGGAVAAAPLFRETLFWGEFMLALFTGFWETLFFYSFVMTVIQEKLRKWSLVNQVLLTTAIFLAFHLPNTLLRFSGAAVISQLILLGLFAVGQAFFFAHNKNGYALAVSHALWGMVLLVHVS